MKVTHSWKDKKLFMEILNQNNLSPSLTIPKGIKMFSRNLERVSPYLATRFAAQLFRTPINFKRPEREAYMYNSAQKKILNIGSIQKKVEILSYGYSDKKVLLAHGWAGRSTQLYAFADKLLEKGYMVISFDGPGHGKSTGKTTNLIDFIETVKVIQNQLGPFHAYIGHSFGAICGFNAVASFLDVKCMISIGSADKVSKIMERFTKNLTLKPMAGKQLQMYAEKLWKVNVDDYSASYVAKKIDQPVLIIHDTLDGDVPVSCAYQIRQSLKNGTLFITHGLGHTKILRDKNVVEKAIEFIEKNS